MNVDLLQRYDQRVPRYTSYPPAPQFHAGVQQDTYRAWLARVAPGTALSLYLHIPFCDSLCWFCGCHTKIVHRYGPVADYLELLGREISLVVEAMPQGPLPVRHLHFGGGTPTIVSAADLERVLADLRWRFEFAADAEVAIEIDPRALTAERIAALGRLGVTRASLGLQDLDPRVQAAVNRAQSLVETREAVTALRQEGIGGINIDLMYGLPHQSVDGIRRTVEAVVGLAPERVCLFGYAHVPWMKRHQRLIDEAALPGAALRFAQYVAAAEQLCAAGYVWIGLDHFARPDDPLAVALRAHRLHRNFQGYTMDEAPVRLGFGASAIGDLPQGYVQNAPAMPAYKAAIAAGALPTQRGLALADEDRLRGAVIEQLMCYLEVDLSAVCHRFGVAENSFQAEIDGLADAIGDGLVTCAAGTLRVIEHGRPFVRAICARFDSYYAPGEERHARAV